MLENNELYFSRSENPSNPSILECITSSSPARSTKELLARVIYKHIDNDDGKIILDLPILTETKSPLMLALAKARITPKDVLTVSKWADVFHDQWVLERLSLGAEDYIQEEIQVSEAGKASGLQEATEQISNEASRKKIKDDFSSFLNFPKDYQSQLIKPGVKKSNGK